jgi:alpha-beta hydrolase superfamily lysophospholipase
MSPRIKVAPSNPKIERLTFTADGFRLVGRLHHSGVAAFPVVIGCHGLESDAGSPKQRALADACTARGIAYLRFDHRGCGESEGTFAADTTFAGRVRDLWAAVDAVRRVPGAAGPIALFGSSLGAAVCMAAAEAVNPAATVLFAAPVRSRTIAGVQQHSAIFQEGGGLDFDLGAVLPRLHHLLVIHGTADAVVPVADAREIFAAAGHPKRLLRQPDGDHRMSDPAHQVRFVAEAVDWFAMGFDAGHGTLPVRPDPSV